MSEVEIVPQVAQARKLGDLMSASLNMFIDGWPRFAAILAVGLLPGALALAGLNLFYGYQDENAVKLAFAAKEWGQLASLLALGLAAKALETLALLALILVIDAFDRKQDMALGEAYDRAAGRFWPFLLTLLLVFVWVMGGTLLLIIPGILMAIRFSLAHVAVVLEGASGDAALERSKHLVLAHMGKVVGNAIVMALITVAVSAVLAFLVNLGGAFLKGSVPFMPQIVKILARFLGELVHVWFVAFYVLLFKDLAALHPKPA